ncbi:MAG: hypothetical protein Q8L69_14585 [Gallionellaceae bacterium]|nr:hypothetical protein [Gallionellaceae bacterium]
MRRNIENATRIEQDQRQPTSQCNQMQGQERMRLTASQIEIIRQAAHQNFGADASVWLFGSRVDDQSAESIWISSITLFEARYGIALSASGQRKINLHERFDQLLQEDLENRVLLQARPSENFSTARSSPFPHIRNTHDARQSYTRFRRSA